MHIYMHTYSLSLFLSLSLSMYQYLSLSHTHTPDPGKDCEMLSKLLTPRQLNLSVNLMHFQPFMLIRAAREMVCKSIE